MTLTAPPTPITPAADSVAAASAGFDLFVSFAMEDRAYADALVSHLESAGLRCWIAPRNIPEGVSYAKAIVEGIRSSGHFLVLLSAATAASPHVIRELESAVAAERRIITVRLPGGIPNDELAYYLATTQWIDASGEQTWTADVSRVLAVVRRDADKPTSGSPLWTAVNRVTGNGELRALLFAASLSLLLATAVIALSPYNRVGQTAVFLQTRLVILMLLGLWFGAGLLLEHLIGTARVPAHPLHGRRLSNRSMAGGALFALCLGLWSVLQDDPVTWIADWSRGPFALVPSVDIYGLYELPLERVRECATALVLAGCYFAAVVLFLSGFLGPRPRYARLVIATSGVAPWLIPTFESSEHIRPLAWAWAVGTATGAWLAMTLPIGVTVRRLRLRVSPADPAAGNEARGLLYGGMAALAGLSLLMLFLDPPGAVGGTMVFTQNRLLVLVLMALWLGLAVIVEELLGKASRPGSRRRLARWSTAAAMLAGAAGIWSSATGASAGWLMVPGGHYGHPLAHQTWVDLDLFGMTNVEYAWGAGVALTERVAVLLTVSLYLAAFVYFVSRLRRTPPVYGRVAVMAGVFLPFLVVDGSGDPVWALALAVATATAACAGFFASARLAVRLQPAGGAGHTSAH